MDSRLPFLKNLFRPHTRGLHRYIILLLLSFTAALPAHTTRAADPANPLGLRLYSQELDIHYASPADATRAQLQFAPVYNGKTWAFSARWDDNSTLDFPVQALMVKHGLKGTFYLNRSLPNFNAQSVAQLMTGDCSIGGHTQTHPWLPAMLANEMFYELLANRV